MSVVGADVVTHGDGVVGVGELALDVEGLVLRLHLGSRGSDASLRPLPVLPGHFLLHS